MAAARGPRMLRCVLCARASLEKRSYSDLRYFSNIRNVSTFPSRGGGISAFSGKKSWLTC